MPNYNKIMLMGNLTRDMELRYTQSGTPYAQGGMAVNRKWKDKEETCFVDFTAFGKQAEVLCEYVRKGSPLFIEGRLQLDTWEKDGQKRSKHKVIVEGFQFLGSGEKRDRDDSRNGNIERPVRGPGGDDIPF